MVEELKQDGTRGVKNVCEDRGQLISSVSQGGDTVWPWCLAGVQFPKLFVHILLMNAEGRGGRGGVVVEL